VRWTEKRAENLTAGAHARDQIHRIVIVATEEGRIVAIRDDVIVNLGAFNVLGLVVPYNTLSHLLGPYDVPHASISVKGVLTNTCFTTPYRGAGRREAAVAMERVIRSQSARPHLGSLHRAGDHRVGSYGLRHGSPSPRPFRACRHF